ncbi:MAG: hypothetical protein UZ09_BCD002001920 [Bacteroidetes bacterium OLB9]|nr:MAG: hypothetical protein UZ09_BCD002001920 [Bacteroidetes bacterium OLB9]
MNMVQKVIYFITEHVKHMSVQLIYSTLLMIFAYKSKNTPKWARRIILGAFAYLLSPIDSIPDLTPFLGFTDDLGVLSFGLVTIACYIDDDIKSIAKAKLQSLIKIEDLSVLESVDAKL